MKKLLFVAVFAIVAAGGAFAVKADTYYGAGGTPVYECLPVAQLECSDIPVDIWESPNNQTPLNRIDKSTLMTQFNP